MKIDDVKWYLAKSKGIWELGCMAIKTIRDYLTSEFKDHMTVYSDKDDLLKINFYGYNIQIKAEMNWDKENPKSILKVSNQFLNNQNILEDKVLIKYYIDNSGLVTNESKKEVGLVVGKELIETRLVNRGAEKDFQIAFITDVFSKIFTTDRLTVSIPVQSKS